MTNESDPSPADPVAAPAAPPAETAPTTPAKRRRVTRNRGPRKAPASEPPGQEPPAAPPVAEQAEGAPPAPPPRAPRLPASADTSGEPVPTAYSSDDDPPASLPPPAIAKPPASANRESQAAPPGNGPRQFDDPPRQGNGHAGQNGFQGKGRFKQKPFQHKKKFPAPPPQAGPDRFKKKEFRKFKKPRRELPAGDNGLPDIETGELDALPLFQKLETLAEFAATGTGGDGDPVEFVQLLTTPLRELQDYAQNAFSLRFEHQAPVRERIIDAIIEAAWIARRPVYANGIVELTEDGNGLIVYTPQHYRVRTQCAFLPRLLLRRYGIKRGTMIRARLHPKRKPWPNDAFEQIKAAGIATDSRDEQTNGSDEPEISDANLAALFPPAAYLPDAEAAEETCPYVVAIESLMEKDPELNLQVAPFEDLVPYYPTERIILETEPKVKWDNIAMRAVDLLTPVGLGQRGLIVAPPRTGKTILQQSMANAIAVNKPGAYLIILLIDERPEEVTDFRRMIQSGEIIASTFDEPPENHVHCAEMVIEKARRMVEDGRHVIILLDSITRLARAYNALASNSGKILSGGVEATALQKPKRFFGSARNIEGAGSLTIIGTALVETGSRMDEVIFEEFKGTGNMELHLDRALSDKRIFPAIEMNKSGTRKEELLYHPDEMMKVYGLRRAMKGVPPTDAMEMLLGRIRKTPTNIAFLLGLNS
jgi:transcription termination factor Rho